MEFIHKHVDELESSNDSLWALCEKESLSNFYTLSTGFQTKGKGMDANIWESAKDQNILMSFVVYPVFLPAAFAFQISRWVSVSILEYLKSKSIKDVKIKWPNDIYIADKKIVGMLIKNAISGDKLSKSMIGVGLNLNQLVFESNAPNPVSLSKISKVKYNIQQEIALLITHLQNYYSWIAERPQELEDNYLNLLYQKGEWHQYQTKDKKFHGKINGVDQFGRLILENQNGKIHVFDIKEIRFL